MDVECGSYQRLFDKTKKIIKDAQVKFSEERSPIYLKKDKSGVLQTRNGMNCPKDKAPADSILSPPSFTNKCLSSTEHKRRYLNI